MTSTEKFQQHIEQYLHEYAQKEVGFSDKLNNPDKCIEKCCEYIISEVKNSGRTAFADEEIYGMAQYFTCKTRKTDDTGKGKENAY